MEIVERLFDSSNRRLVEYAPIRHFGSLPLRVAPLWRPHSFNQQTPMPNYGLKIIAVRQMLALVPNQLLSAPSR